jgi:hypothetical protein
VVSTQPIIMLEPFILLPVPTAYQPLGAQPPSVDMVMLYTFCEGL